MLLQSVIPISDSLILFCNLTNKWFIYCIVLVFVCIAHYFRDLSYLKLCLNQMIYYVLILWTLMSWRTLTVCLLEQWASSMQSFTRVIIGVDALESEFLRIKQLQMMNLQLILTTMKSSCSLIASGTKNLSKFIYTLVNFFFITLQNLLNFYFWFHTVIYIGRVYLVQSEIPALVVSVA